MRTKSLARSGGLPIVHERQPAPAEPGTSLDLRLSACLLRVGSSSPSTFRWLGWAAAALLVGQAVARADNPCIESGPHTGPWSCISPSPHNTTINATLCQAVTPPTFQVPSSLSKQRAVTYDCDQYRNHTEIVSIPCQSSALYFIDSSGHPTSFPSVFTSQGVYTFTAVADLTPTAIVGWWPGEGNANDVAEGNNGASIGAPTYALGRVGRCFVFNANGQAIRVGNTASLQMQDFSIEAWVKRSNASVSSPDHTGGLIFSYGSQGYGFGMWDDGRLFLSKIDVDVATGAAAITDNTTWHHVAVTKSGYTVTFYIDGAPTTTDRAYNPDFTFSSLPAIGSRGDGSGGTFLGSIDEPTVYSCTLSGAAIQAIFNAGAKCGFGVAASGCAVPSPDCACSAGRLTLGTVTVNVTGTAAPVVTSQPASQNLAVGDAASFSVGVCGSPTLNYQWSFNGTDISGATSSTYTRNNVQLSDSGTYAVRVSDSLGIVTGSAVLTVSRCDPSPAGIVSWWQGEGDAEDVYGLNPGVGGLSYDTGEVGQAFAFDGSSAYVRVPLTTALNVGQQGAFTLEGWVKPSFVTSDQPLFAWEHGCSLWLSASVSGSLKVTVKGIDPVTGNVLAAHNASTAGGPVQAGQFQHIAMTCGPVNSSGQMPVSLFVNGTQVLQTTINGWLGTLATAGDLYFGYDPDASTRAWFAGLIDEVGLYGRALSASEIQSLYRVGSHGKCPVPPAFLSPTVAAVAVTAGNDVVFRIPVKGTSLTYQWSGPRVGNGSQSSLALQDVQPSDAGNYTLQVSDSLGTITSLPLALTVNDAVCVSQPSGMVSWWEGENNPDDVFGLNPAVPIGNLPYPYATGKVGSSIYCDPNQGYYVVAPASTSLNVASGGSFTAEAWINAQDVSFPQPLLAWSGGVSIWLGRSNFGSLDANVRMPNAGGSVDSILVAPAAGIGPYSFYHIALTYDLNGGGLMRLYVNGVKVAETSAVPATGGPFSGPPLTTGDLWLGSSRDGFATGDSLAGSVLDGEVDEVVVYNRALSDAEVLAIYNAGSAGRCTGTPAPVLLSGPASQTVTEGNDAVFQVLTKGTALAYQWTFDSGPQPITDANQSTLYLQNVQSANAGTYTFSMSQGTVNSTPATLTVVPAVAVPPPSGVVGWWRGEGDGADALVANPATLEGSTTFEAGKVGQAFRFGPSSDLRVPAPANWNSATWSGFTFEAWAFAYDVSSAQPLFEQFNSTTGERVTLSISLRAPGSFDVTYVNPAGHTTAISSPPGVIRSFTSQHVAVTYASSGTLSLYVNGALMAQGSVSIGLLLGSQDLLFGYSPSGSLAQQYFNGDLDELTIYSRPLGASEIQAIYSAGSAGKIPPCVQLPTGAVSWWQGAGNGADGLGANPAVLEGGVGFAPGEVGQAFAFSGAADARVPESLSLDVGEGSGFTIEGWLKPASVSAAQPLIEWNTGYATGVALWLSPAGTYGMLNADVRDLLLNDNSISGGQVTAASFQHVALTYDSSDFTAHLFLNGTEIGSTVCSVFLQPMTASDLYFGFSPLDDLGTSGQPGTGTQFAGQLDEVTLYSRALSAQEVRRIYAAAGGGKCDIPPAIIVQPSRQTVNAGNTVAFSVSASGTSLTYQWYVDYGLGQGPVAIYGATGPTLTLTDVQPGNSGSYTVTVANGSGSVTSIAATLTVNAVCDPQPSGIVSWWRAEGDATDSVGGNNGALENGAGFASGEAGQAFALGGNSYIQVADNPSLRLTSGLTIECWVKPASLGAGQNILAKWDVTGNQKAYRLWLHADGRAGFDLSHDGFSANTIHTHSPLPVNQWTHLAGTFTGLRMALYVNGILDAPGPVSPSIYAGTDALGIGATLGAGGPASYFNGDIDEVSVYNRALTRSEIADLYAAGSFGKCAGPPPSSVFITPPSMDGCHGDTQTFTASAAGSGTLAYQWSKNGIAVNGATASTYSISTASVADSGTYSVTVYDSLGRTTSAGAALAVHPRPTAALNIGGAAQTTIQSGGSGADITVDLTGTGPWTLVWSDGTTETAPSSPHDRVVNPASTTIYKLLALSDQYCPAPPADLASSVEVNVSGASLLWPLRATEQDLSGSYTNFTFGGDEFFLVNSQVDLYGATTIEGGTLVLFPCSDDARIIIHDPTIVCDTGPYRTATFMSQSSQNYQSVYFDTSSQCDYSGQGLSLDLSGATTVVLKYLQFFNLGSGISFDGNGTYTGTLYDCQFVDCNNALAQTAPNAIVNIYNALFADDASVFTVDAGVSSPQVNVQHITVDGSQSFVSGAANGGTWTGKNSLFVNVQNSSSIPSALQSSPTCRTISSPTAVFQPGADGSHYLKDNTYRSQGTLSIDPTLLNELPNKTTYPPMDFPLSYQMAGSMTLSPQVPRYTVGSNPDLGYYFDVLDYTVSQFLLPDGGQLNILPGTAIGLRYDWYIGFDLRWGSSFSSQGTPNRPNTFAPVSTVQEGPYYCIGLPGFLVSFVPDYWPQQVEDPTLSPDLNPNGDPPPALNFRFSNLYLAAGGPSHHFWGGSVIPFFFNPLIFPDQASHSSVMFLQMRDCALHGGWIDLGEPDIKLFPPVFQVDWPDWLQPYCGPATQGAVSLFNNIFDRVNINLDADTGPVFWYGPYLSPTIDMQLTATNNTFRGGWLFMEPINASAGNWILENNLFDKTVFAQDQYQPLDYDYNAYWPCTSSELQQGQTAQLVQPDLAQNGYPADGYRNNHEGQDDLVLGAAPQYLPGPLGNFYQPPGPGNPLVDRGQTTADQIGLFHYTTQVGQQKEGVSTADIGVHYVAVGGNGKPLDYDNDGIPDYVEDANGNGLAGAGETDWQSSANNDPANAVYDNVDLSGDGLVGRIKKALGMAPLDPSNPLSLNQVAYDGKWSISTYRLPIDYTTLTSIGALNLNVDGVDATLEGLFPADDTKSLLKWGTTFSPLGSHFVQARLTLSSGQADGSAMSAVGPLAVYSSDNLLQFFESDTMYLSSLAYLDAQLASQKASYEIRLYDPSTSPPGLINTISGSTINGMIQEDWNLKYGDGVTPFAGSQVEADFDVTLMDDNGTPIAQKQSARTYNRVVTTEKASPKGYDGFDVVYFYSPYDNSLSSVFDRWGEVWLGMQGVVDVLTFPQLGLDVYYSIFNVFGYPTVFAGYPGYVTSQTAISYLLYPDMASGTTKYFYAHCHGTPLNLQNKAGDVKINALDLGKNVLGNQYSIRPSDADPDQYVFSLCASNPYRFVFLDACYTAGSWKEWRRAFGIYPYSGVDGAGRTTLGNQAFVGWNGEHADYLGGYYPNGVYNPNVPNSGVLDVFKSKLLATACTQTLQQFYLDWMNGATVAQCIRDAVNPNLAPCPFAVPKTKPFTVISGGTSFVVDHFPKCPIYIVGHPGLTVTGTNPADDDPNPKNFASPVDQ